MKTKTEILKIHNYTSRIFNMYFGGKKFATFDLETTGLSPSYCKIIVSGILIYDGENYRVLQFFAEKNDDEAEIIESTLNVLKDTDYIITYNGKHFDIPFIKKRAEKNCIPFTFKGYNLDLYLTVNGHSLLKNFLPNLKQKSLEVFMGLADSRDDEISGEESIKLYEKYLISGSLELEKEILLHNHDDIIQLLRLLPVIGKCDFHKAMYKLGFPVGKFNVGKISLSGCDLHVTGTQNSQPCDYVSFPTAEKPYAFSMDKCSENFDLVIYGETAADAVFFDAETILGSVEKLKRYPNIENGYLIARNHETVNYLEINAFLIQFFKLFN